MKRLIIIAAALYAFSAGISAQDMKAVFTAMPDEYVPQLEAAWRKDLIDLFLSGKEAVLKNTMNGYARLWNLSEDYVKVQSTERTTVELKLLPLVNRTYIICMSTTVEGPAPDSRLQFFTVEWQPLDGGRMLPIMDADFFISEDADRESDAFKDAVSLLDMDLIRYGLNAENTDLTAEYSTPLYLSDESRGRVLPFLKASPRVYRWEMGFFR